MRREGDMVRIYAELIDARDGSTMWSQRYDRPYKDLFQLQDEITDAVAGVLKTKLLGGGNAVAQTDRPPRGNLDAYNSYLQGVFYLARHNEADTRKAIDAFATATHIDPRYAAAWADLSNAWSDLGQEFLSGAGAGRLRAGACRREYGARARPDLANAHSAKGNLLLAGTRTGAAPKRNSAAPCSWSRTWRPQKAISAPHSGRSAIRRLRQTLRGPHASDPLYAFWFDQLSRFLGMLGRSTRPSRRRRRRSS